MSTCDDIMAKLNTIESQNDSTQLLLGDILTEVNKIGTVLSNQDSISNNQSFIIAHIDNVITVLKLLKTSLTNILDTSKANQKYLRDDIFPNLIVGDVRVQLNNIENVLKKINTIYLGGS